MIPRVPDGVSWERAPDALLACYLQDPRGGQHVDVPVDGGLGDAGQLRAELGSRQRPPASELPFGLPASYWLDLRDYDPVATAAALDRPMLILQGGRDFQVTAEDDLSRWQAGLGSWADVTIRVHEADNHLFFPGTGPSTPAEYETPQHVDPAVVADIARWLTPDKAAGEDGR